MFVFHVSKKENQTEDKNIFFHLAENYHDNSIGLFATNEHGEAFGRNGLILCINGNGTLTRTKNCEVPGITKNKNKQIMIDEEYADIVKSHS